MDFHNPPTSSGPAVRPRDRGWPDAALPGRYAPADAKAGSGLRVWVFPDGAGNVLLTLRGELDELSAPLNALIPGVPDDSRPHRAPRTVTLDFAGVKFVSARGSAHLQQLFEDLTGAGWQISLANARPDVADLLAIALQHRILTPAKPNVSCASETTATRVARPTVAAPGRT